MKKSNLTPFSKAFFNSKGINIIPETDRVFIEFSEHPQTMLQVSEKTGIYRANICRYIAKWRKHNLIAMVGMGKCPISGRKVQFFSTNPEHINKLSK